MTFIDRFTDRGFEAAEAALHMRLHMVEQRMDAVHREQLVDINWLDEEIAEENGISIKPNWVSVGDPRGIAEGRFLIAAIVSEDLDQDDIPYARSLVLIGRKIDSEKESFQAIGKLYPGQYDGDPLMLLMQFREDFGMQPVPWESADAAIFLKLVEQVLPEIEEEEPLDDFGA